MKKVLLLLILVVGFAGAAVATRITFQLEGYISEFSSYYVSDIGISVGDPFTGILSYDLVPFNPSGAYTYPQNGLSYCYFGFTVEGNDFWCQAPGHHDRVSIQVTDSPGGDSINLVSGDSAWEPWKKFADNWMLLSMNDDLGLALSSVALPTQLDIADWSSASVYFKGSAGAFNESASVRGEITSIRLVPVSVPDVVSSVNLFMFALASVFACRRVRKM